MTFQDFLCRFGLHKGQWGEVYKEDTIVNAGGNLTDIVALGMDSEQIEAFRDTGIRKTEYRQDRTCENCKIVSRREV